MFLLTENERKILDAWQKEQDEKVAIETNRTHPYYGAIGGSLTYKFTPTSLGTIIKVEHTSGEEIDLTDYEDW